MFTFDDGVNQFTSYADPKPSEALTGQGQLIPTLDGGAFLAYQYRQDGEEITVQQPRCVVFEWEDLAPQALVPLLQEAWRRQRHVTVTWPSTLDPDTTDTLTGYLPVHQPPETEPTGARCIRVKFTLQEVR